MNLSVVAAFTAAALSLINVMLSSRLAGRGQLEQWRRDEARPIVAHIITLSDDAVSAWQQAAWAKQQWIESMRDDPDRSDEDVAARDTAREQWRIGSDLFGKLRYELAQLELVAGRPVRDIATALIREHESVWHVIRPAGGADDPIGLCTNHTNKIVGLHVELVAKTRLDLGLDRGGVRNRLHLHRLGGTSKELT